MYVRTRDVGGVAFEVSRREGNDDVPPHYAARTLTRFPRERAVAVATIRKDAVAEWRASFSDGA